MYGYGSADAEREECMENDSRDIAELVSLGREEILRKLISYRMPFEKRARLLRKLVEIAHNDSSVEEDYDDGSRCWSGYGSSD